VTLQERFSQLSTQGEKALVVYVTAGDPPLDQLPAILESLQEGGADIIEVGMPFSDPIGDGPTIQASSQRALDRGTTPTAVFDMLAQVRLQTPLVIMCYANTVMNIGARDFAYRCRQVRVSGVIVVDAIPEAIQEWRPQFASAGVDLIYLAAPTSTEERLKALSEVAQGFIYVVSRTGVTGTENSAGTNLNQLIENLRKYSKLPLCVGFGISTPEQIKEICSIADGAVVGSHIVNLLNKEWKLGAGKERLIKEIALLKSGTKQ
jgi:tryptophan synthase alpha chain